MCNFIKWSFNDEKNQSRKPKTNRQPPTSDTAWPHNARQGQTTANADRGKSRATFLARRGLQFSKTGFATPSETLARRGLQL